MLPIFAESYHDLKKINKVLEDLLKAAPFSDKDIAPKGILKHIICLLFVLTCQEPLPHPFSAAIDAPDISS